MRILLLMVFALLPAISQATIFGLVFEDQIKQISTQKSENEYKIQIIFSGYARCADQTALTVKLGSMFDLGTGRAAVVGEISEREIDYILQISRNCFFDAENAGEEKVDITLNTTLSQLFAAEFTAPDIIMPYFTERGMKLGLIAQVPGDYDSDLKKILTINASDFTETPKVVFGAQ